MIDGWIQTTIDGPRMHRTISIPVAVLTVALAVLFTGKSPMVGAQDPAAPTPPETTATPSPFSPVEEVQIEV